uniref:Uncharacterized protein n=1 Tax=Branchiostoma floridae TaxID=7739 RepID=C3Y9F5_BRAFL|eukprot:XP_002607201.1 hypothetical protein BRAFLDRAFT_68002 [Branchiostoma floridae]
MSSPGQVNQGLLAALRVLREALKEEKLVLFLGEKISALPQPATLGDWWTRIQDESGISTEKLKKLEEDYLQRLGERPSLPHASLRTLGRFPIILTTNMDCLVERLVWAPQGIVGEALRLDQVVAKQRMEELCTSDGEEARFLEKLFNERSVLFLGCDPDLPLYSSALQRFAENSKTRHFVVVPAKQRGLEERGSLSLLNVDLDLPSLAQLLNPGAKPLDSPTEKTMPKTSESDADVKPCGEVPKDSDVIQLLCLGTGKGMTAVMTGEPSSSMVILHNSTPVLLVDAGLGVTQSLLHSINPEKFPDAMFVTHNHSDHAGELPLLLGGAAQRRLLAGKPKVKLLCGPKVQEPLKVHRLSEMANQLPPDDIADWLICDPEGDPVYLDDVKNFKLQAVESQHDLPCYGFLLYYKDELILGFSSDSGFTPKLYDRIFEAPTVVVDGRTPSSKWHASKKPGAVYAIGYGTTAEYTAEDGALRPLQRGQYYTLWSGQKDE